jgi:hypothetical protein
MKFINTATNRGKRFSIGREADSGRYYLAIAVANSLVDYMEYYQISREFHDGYPANEAELDAFAEECRKQKHDHLLFYKPGNDRGVAI